ncbi:MAG: sulfotransferase [Pseudomonadales bacterium]
MNETVSSAIEQVRKAQQLIASGDKSAAAELLNSVLAAQPDHIEARLTQAVLQRLDKRLEVALDTLESLIELAPALGRAHQEVAKNLLAMNKPMLAGAALEKAVACDPGLLESWKLLTALYEKMGNSKATESQEQVAHLQRLPAELRSVISYLAEDRLLDAERLCKFYMQKNPKDVEGMRLLAEIANRNNVLEDAEFLLESALEFEPSHIDAAIQYINILVRRQRFHKAYEKARQLFKDFPDARNKTRVAYASACFGIGLNAEALEQYQQMLKRTPDNHLLHISHGHVLSAVGDSDKATESFKRSADIKPDHGDAYWSLANTKAYRFDEQQIEQMLAAETNSNTALLDRIQLNFALGKAFEDQQDYDAAFGHYARGNALKLPTTHHSAAQLKTRVDSQIEVCTRDLFDARQGLGDASEDPIFILGLPRAGSTLLEQILASHSMVDGTMELHNILDLAKRLRGREEKSALEPRYPKILNELEDSYFARFGHQFIEDTQSYRGKAPYFIDKMPNNFFHIGLIKLILPNAKIIDARRHPMACCFSGYKQLFGEGQEFTYGLTEIGNYYREYMRLMDHWDQVLPGFVLRVEHEEVVADLEKQVRRILNFCGLPFEAACLEFHKTERSIRTPSAEQVRQPIYTTGLEQWRNFEAYLEPLINALGPEVLQRYPING